MSPQERDDLSPDFRRLLTVWRTLREMGCSPDEIRHGLSYPGGAFERCVADGRSVGIDKKTLDGTSRLGI